MAIDAACQVLKDAMARSGMDYAAISEKTGVLSVQEVEELCTGKRLATPAQHRAISEALGLETGIQMSANVLDGQTSPCLGLALHGDTEILSDSSAEITEYHDVNEALGLVRHHWVQAMYAIECLKRDGSLPGQDVDFKTLHKRFKFTEDSLRDGFTDKEMMSLPHHDGLNPVGKGFTWLKLKGIVKYTEDTARFDFAFDNPEVVSNVLVSSTCVVTAPKEKPLYEDPGAPPICPPKCGQKPPFNVYRAYTPITERGTPGIISFAIKKQDKGKMSNYVHNMKIGETLGIMGYLQRIPSMISWELNKYDAVTLLAGGVGLTPLLQILQYSLPYDYNKTKFLLLYANRHESDIAMRSELNAYAEKYPANFEVVYVLSNPPPDWDGEIGRIDERLVLKYAPPPATLVASALVCVSGPPAMLNALAGPREGDRYKGWTGQGELKGVLKQVGYTAQQVHKF